MQLAVLLPRGLENCTTNPAAYLKLRVGGVDNSIGLHFGYIVADNGKWHMASLTCTAVLKILHTLARIYNGVPLQ